MDFSPDSRFMRVCLKITAFVKLNLLTLLFSLPLFTIGAAQTALFDQLDSLSRSGDVTLRTFAAAFRRCFRRATPLWLGCVFLGCMLALDYRIVAGMDFPGRMAVICLICFCFLALLLTDGILFPLLALTRDRAGTVLVNAILLTLARLPHAFLILSARVLPILLAVAFPPAFVFFSFLLPLAGFSLIAAYQLGAVKRAGAVTPDPQEETQRCSE